MIPPIFLLGGDHPMKFRRNTGDFARTTKGRGDGGHAVRHRLGRDGALVAVIPAL
jgi:hypothetical protein